MNLEVCCCLLIIYGIFLFLSSRFSFTLEHYINILIKIIIFFLNVTTKFLVQCRVEINEPTLNRRLWGFTTTQIRFFRWCIWNQFKSHDDKLNIFDKNRQFNNNKPINKLTSFHEQKNKRSIVLNIFIFCCCCCC